MPPGGDRLSQPPYKGQIHVDECLSEHTCQPRLERALEVGVRLLPARLCPHAGSEEGTGLGCALQPSRRSSTGTSRDGSRCPVRNPLSEVKGKEARQWPGGGRGSCGHPPTWAAVKTAMLHAHTAVPSHGSVGLAAAFNTNLPLSLRSSPDCPEYA